MLLLSRLALLSLSSGVSISLFFLLDGGSGFLLSIGGTLTGLLLILLSKSLQKSSSFVSFGPGRGWMLLLLVSVVGDVVGVCCIAVGMLDLGALASSAAMGLRAVDSLDFFL